MYRGSKEKNIKSGCKSRELLKLTVAILFAFLPRFLNRS